MSETQPTGARRLDAIFEAAKAEGRGALMPFVCGQHPKPGATAETLKALEGAGADIVEIGFPFSDPIADGPVIADAMHVALQNGATIAGLIDEVASVRSEVSMGLVAMVTVSIVSRLGGPSAFCERIKAAGFDGMIVPDLPIEEAKQVSTAADAAGLGLAMLVAPSTSKDRAAQIVGACRGFVYVLAQTGITGERSEGPQIEKRAAGLRTLTDLPLAVGFGISTGEHVAAACRHADAAIVGSALVRRMGGSDRPAQAAAEFVREIAGSTAKPEAMSASSPNDSEPTPASDIAPSTGEEDSQS